MSEQFTEQAKAAFDAAKDGKIPEGFQAIAEDTVAKSRDAYEKFNGVAQDGVKVFEDVVITSQAGVKTIGEKIFKNTTTNTQAAFDVAEAIARARSLPEVLRLQADFAQQQFAATSAQTKELFELSTKVAKETVETMNAAATKSFEQLKK